MATSLDELQELVSVYYKYGGPAYGAGAKAAQTLGLKRKTFEGRLRRAAVLGLTPRKPVMPGFQINQVSTQQDENEEVQKTWTTQVPEREQHELPDGHVIDRLSVLTDAQGNLIQKWTKSKVETDLSDIKQALLASFAEYKGHASLPTAPDHVNDELLTVYPVADHHLGLYAWAEEAGDNYDLAIGEKLLKDTMATLVAGAPPSETAIILNLGDFFHFDDNTSRTRKGTQLDVDSRYAKVLRVGVNLLIHCTQLALQKHSNVIIRCLPGNHDPYAAIALAIGLAAFFDNDMRVTVDTNPSTFFHYRFGKVFLTATHGDMVKPDTIAGVVAATWPQHWGETEFRYSYLGHVHHKSVGGGEKHGLIWETFQTLAPKDVWHYSMGYRSGRSMVAITHHHASGEYLRHTAAVNTGVSHAPSLLQDKIAA